MQLFQTNIFFNLLSVILGTHPWPLSVVAKRPGPQHDAGMFERFALKTHLETNDCGWLLGNSGYPLKRYLITLKPNPTGVEEVNFHLAHSRTRMVVERGFGVLKVKIQVINSTYSLYFMYNWFP